MSTLSFDVLWRDRGAQRGLKNLGDETERARRRMDAFKVGAATAGLVVGAAVLKFGKDSVRAYSEAQQSQLRLQDAFKKFPQLADTNIGALRGLNTELAKKTRFDDDATASGQAVLAQFKLTGQEITQLTPLLQDYAAKTGRDLPDAAKVLGKAMLGNGRALKEVGINFKDTGDRGENFNQIMVGLRTQVGGFAEKEGKTAAGQIAILQNQFGELQEAVGAKLVPALSKGVGLLTDFVGFIDKNKAVVGPLTASIAGIAGSITLVVVAAKGIRAVSSAFDTLGISAKGASLAVTGVGVAIGIATLVIGHYAKKNAEAKQQTDSFTQALIESKGAIDANVRAMAAKALQDRGAFDNAQKLGLSLQDVTDAALGNEPAMQRVMAAVNRYASAVDVADTKTQDQVDAANELADALLPVRNQFNNGQKAAGQFGQATAESTNKVKDSKQALQQWRSEMVKAARAAIDLQGSQDAVEAAVDDATAAVKANGKTLDNNTEKGRSNRAALRNLATSSIAYREKLIEQGASQKKVTGTTMEAREAFIKTAIKMGATRKEAKELADKFGLVDKKINDLNNKTVKTKVTFSVSGSGFKLHIPNSLSVVKEMASGGPVRGPGGTTSDSVLGVDTHGIPTARVSAGEFVVNAKAYQRNKSLVEAINRDGLAVGGVVDPRIFSNRFPNPGYTGNALQTRAARAISKSIGNAVGKALESTGMGVGFTGPSGPRTSFRGGTFTTLFARNLALVERAAHQTFRVFQGGWRPRTSYSGTSHAGDAIDFQVNYSLGRLFRKYIGASGDRTGKGNWSPHIHAVPSPSHGRARGSAVWQYQDYVRRGGARQSMRSPWGLASGGLVEPALAWYDKGGELRPGWTMAYNGTGRNEMVTPTKNGAGTATLTAPRPITIMIDHGDRLVEKIQGIIDENDEFRATVGRAR